MLRLAIAAICGLLLTVPALSQAAMMTDDEIATLLERRVEVERRGIGLVVGILEGDAARIVAYGQRALDDQTLVDGDTVFEIGSITKVFTGLLLAEAIRRGEVRPDQPVAELLPPGTRVPSRGDRQVTLHDLTTHTSALPRMPDNFAPADWRNPYSDYTAEQLYAFLAGYELPRDIGAEHEYSNLAVGLLGHVLARAAGTDYETLLRTRILEPLGMHDTAIVLSPAQAERLATGHDETRAVAASWTWDVLVGAGGLRSTANDLLIFLRAAMDPSSPLAPLFSEALAHRRPAGGGIDIGFGWLVGEKAGQLLVWHSGGTGGYRAFVGYRPDLRCGVVVLSNLATTVATDDIGMHLLDPELPLADPPVVREAIVLPPEKLDAVVGHYEFNPQLVMEVRREGDKLIAQATGQIPAEIFPQSDSYFFYKIVDAQLEFAFGADGKATGVTLYQAGMTLPAPRVK